MAMENHKGTLESDKEEGEVYIEVKLINSLTEMKK